MSLWALPRTSVDGLVASSSDATFFEALAKRLDDLSGRSYFTFDARNGFPSAGAMIFIHGRPGGDENVCLVDDRSFLLSLVAERVVDTVHFPLGLPKTVRRRFSSRMQPSTIVGRRSHVALTLLEDAYWRMPQIVVEPIRRILSRRWDILDAVEDVIELTYEQRKPFLRACAELNGFKEIASTLEAAARSKC
ncbi:MAG TPA: hypothetical protein VJ724_04810 [Tahibacter sp.]|nr:hypothetical protein [Tahibacter sp.]